MGTQPAGTGPTWGAQWRDTGMAEAYAARHGYPPETFGVIAGLRVDGPSLPVLEIGAGNGRVTAGLVERGLVPIDAVEPSAAMVERAPSSLRGDSGGVRWIVSSFEDAPLAGPYGLAVAGESIHWTDWPVSFPKLAGLLADGAVLVLVGLLESGVGFGRPGSQPWLPAVQEVIAEFATSHEYVPYDLPAALRDGGHWTELGAHRTAWDTRIPTVDDVVRRYHSMNGLSPERLGDRLTACDEALRAALAPFVVDGVLPCEVAGELRWGRPHAGPGRGVT